MVRLGVHNITATHDDNVQNIKIIRTERHIKYNAADATNDIAILYLEKDVIISRES